MSLEDQSYQSVMFSARACACAYRIVQVEALALCLDICEIQVVAPHLVFILHEHLAVRDAVRVADVLEVGHPLRPQVSG